MLVVLSHGMLLLLVSFTFARCLNLIPLSALAAVLLMVGFKLTKPVLYKTQLVKWVGRSFCLSSSPSWPSCSRTC